MAREKIPYPGAWTDSYLEDLARCYFVGISYISGRYEINISPVGMKVLAALREPDFPERCGKNTSLPEVYELLLDRPCEMKGFRLGEAHVRKNKPEQ